LDLRDTNSKAYTKTNAKYLKEVRFIGSITFKHNANSSVTSYYLTLIYYINQNIVSMDKYNIII